MREGFWARVSGKVKFALLMLKVLMNDGNGHGSEESWPDTADWRSSLDANGK